MRIVISGLGLMGGSLAMALKQNLPEARIAGYDLPEVMQQALKRRLIDEAISDWPAQCRGADVLFLATPLRILKKHLSEINGVLGPETVVTDMGSTKMEIAALVNSINFSATYVGGHPMTGAEKSGLSAANPLLYENAVYILTNTQNADAHLLQQSLYRILQALKARVMLMEPQTHDKILAAISHLPQLLAVDLINLVGEKDSGNYPYFRLAAGGFRDLTRIASSSIDIWQDIISSNKIFVRDVLEDMIRLLQRNLQQLDDLRADFTQANTYHTQVPKASKGFLSPLTDVMVYVTDQVGVIAKISNALSEHDVDIRDIELLKIREKEGGVFRLSFANSTEAGIAVSILNKIGYQAAIRE